MELAAECAFDCFGELGEGVALGEVLQGLPELPKALKFDPIHQIIIPLEEHLNLSYQALLQLAGVDWYLEGDADCGLEGLLLQNLYILLKLQLPILRYLKISRNLLPAPAVT